MGNKRKAFNICLTALSLVFALWLGGYLYFVYAVNHIEPPQNERADAIIVVTGASERINKGLDLLHAGYTQELFISGVDRRVTMGKLFSMWDGYEQGNRPCCVTLGHAATNTWGNALEARNWVEAQQDMKTIWLITSAFHMPRAWLELKHALPAIEILPYPVESALTVKEQGGFVRVTMREYHKTVLTYLRVTFLPFELKHKTQETAQI